MNISTKQIWFKLHSSCIPVKGKESSLIYDIEKEQLYPISNDHYELLSLCKTHSLLEMEQVLLETSREDIETFLGHFIEQALGFYTERPQSFPDLDLEWRSPSVITNGIIQVDKTSKFDFEGLIDQFHDLGCDAIQLRFEDNFALPVVEQFMLAFEETRIKLIDLMLPYSQDINKQALLELLDKYKRVGLLRVYGALEDGVWEDDKGKARILLQKKDIRIDTTELINQDRFVVNSYVFMEAQEHNTGLNRKVCVDAKGNIKNYLSHAKSWGNIQQITLKSIVNTKDFQEKWLLSNDKIEQCQDCQFRYACINNSDVIAENGVYRKLTYCNSDGL